MKKFVLILTIILGVTLIYCESNDDENIVDDTPLEEGFVRIGNNDYEIYEYIIELNYYFYDGPMEFEFYGTRRDLIILTKGVTKQLNDGNFEYYGNGYVIILNLITETTSVGTIAPGEFNFAEAEPYQMGSFIGKCLTISNSTVSQMQKIISGTMNFFYVGVSTGLILSGELDNDLDIKINFYNGRKEYLVYDKK
jgi:uncharacterized protein YaiE (UPF0345 family)